MNHISKFRDIVRQHQNVVAQSDGAIEYIECISAEG